MTKGKYIRTEEILEKLRTPKDIQNSIIKDYLDNLEIKQISKKNNVNVCSVYRILKWNNIKLRGRSKMQYSKNHKINIAESVKKTWENSKIREKRIRGQLKVKEQIKFSRKMTFGLLYETEEEEQKRINQYKKDWEIKNPEKKKAQIMAHHHIKISENQLCEMCNQNKAKCRHHFDYSKPLEVNLLCVSCHHKIHKEN